MCKPFCLLVLAGSLLLGGSAASAASAGRPGEYHDATEPAGSLAAIFRHRQAELSRARAAALRSAPAELAPQTPAFLPDAGNIAILDDSEGVVVRPNTFDLQQRTLRFTPSNAAASQYTAAAQALNFDGNADSNGTPLAGLGDDDTRLVPLPFAFPFFGQRHTSIYINSDGNLTFDAGDFSSDPRTEGRAISGPPRLCPFYEDLDPSQPAASVRYLAASDRAVITWDRVPDYASSGIGPRQTFQVTLYPDGRIEFHYQSITGQSAVIGIAPGAQSNGVTAADFSVGVSASASGAIFEAFTQSPSIDFVGVSQKFYRNHDDAYDYIVLFNTVGFSGEPDPSGFAAERNVRNQVQGIGGILRSNPIFDDGPAWGSALRLQSFVNMAQLSSYPADPTAIISILGPNNTLSVLGQENGHRFLAYVRYLDPISVQPSLNLLGRANAHWSFFFNSDASVVEGNRIQDMGAGQSPRFATTGAVEHYGAFDQYLMGLRSPDEVPASFVVLNPSVGLPAGTLPATGIRFNGTRQDITVQMIVAAEGKRVPDSTVSQKRFNYAFALLIPAGTQPSTSDLAKIDQIRPAWENYFGPAVDNRGSARTSLVKQLQLSTWPAGGVIKGSPGTATVSIAAPAAAKLIIQLSAANDAITVPTSVSIAAGATSAGFAITGNHLGVAGLVATASDPAFDIAQTLVQVREDPSQLHLDVVSGASQQGGAGGNLPQRIVLRVHDDNGVPFSGVGVTLSAAADGVVTPAHAFTDSSGQVSVNWRLASSTGTNTLSASLDAASSVATTTTATGLPQPAVTTAGVVNAASFNQGASAANTAISPGSLLSIFGSALSNGTLSATSFPLPTTLLSTSVTMNGIAAPLIYVSPDQINLQAPFELSGSSAQLVITTGAGPSTPVTVPVAAVQPGIFFNPVSGAGVILQNSTGALTVTQPARAGDFLQIYATGLGAVSPAGLTGFAAPASPLAQTSVQPQVTIAGQPASVAFAGLAPGFAGLYQVNVQVPAGIPAGIQSVTLTINGLSSNAVQITTGP